MLFGTTVLYYERAVRPDGTVLVSGTKQSYCADASVVLCLPGIARNPRGEDCIIRFGPDVTRSFLSSTGLEGVIRSHEVRRNQMQNTSASVRFVRILCGKLIDTAGSEG